MKIRLFICLIIIMVQTFRARSQGASCSSPYVLIQDGVCRDYAITSLTGTAQHCTDALYSGTGHVSIFSFTTNNVGACVLVNLTTSGLQAAEVTLYSKCSGGGALQNLQATSSVCFNDGTGFWAPCETLTLAANTTYFLRIWTPGTGTLTLCTKNYNPPNSTCSGATPVGNTPVYDNNACHKPSAEVTPVQLCAFSLENTAFYTYYVEVDGISVIMINNISCDNSAAGATAGFQIGFFTGECGSLISQSCYAATGGSVSAPTNSLPAGTKVTVAIDGMSGSNCSYDITAFNGVFLPVHWRLFSAWKTPLANVLRWSTTMETAGSVMEIERSNDGFNFYKISNQPARYPPNGGEYTYADNQFTSHQYYRLHVLNAAGKGIYSEILEVNRNNNAKETVKIENPVSDMLRTRINREAPGTVFMKIMDNSGQVLLSKSNQLNRGENINAMDIRSLSKGIYYLVISDGTHSKGYTFIKQ